MKLTDIQPNLKVIEEAILIEKLGTLAQLGVGPLINVLKQSTSSGRRGEWTGAVGKKFVGQEIGSTSEVVDVGVIKDGLKGIRKAMKTNEGSRAFALYIGGKPVLFGVYDADTLAGASRVGKLAYDLSAFKDAIAAIDAEKVAGKSEWERQRTQPTKLTTYREKERSSWEPGGTVIKQEKFQGDAVTTRGLVEVVDLIMEIAKRVGQPVTGKVVMSDVSAMKKRQTRYFTRQEIAHAVKDLRTRLATYKNTKQPTVDTIEDFISMSVNKQAKKVQFAGSTYATSAETYDKVNPVDLLSGKPFKVSYRTADPGAYDSLDLTYAYDPKSNMLKPIYATWYDKRDAANRYQRQEAVLDSAGYLKMKLTVSDLDDKDIVLKKTLELFKAKRYRDALDIASSLQQLGKDWPELNAIQKSAKIEYDREKAEKAQR